VAAELTAVLFALRREGRYWAYPAARVPGAPCPAFDTSGEILTLYTGIGQEAAGRAIDWLLTARPGVKRVISAGFCGALAEGLRVGDVVRPGRVVRDGEALTLSGGDPATTLVTLADPILSTADRIRLREATGGDAVDMETAAIAQRCAAAGVVCGCLRVVSDDCRHGLPPDLMPALDGERVRLGRLFLALGRRPSLALDLWRLARDARQAARTLAAALTEALPLR